MMGMAEKLTGIVPGGTVFGKYYPHPLMSEGALMLFDPSHSQGGLSALPAHDGRVPNVAQETAAALTGAAGAALDGIMLNDDSGAGAASSLKELTATGGLYGLYSHAESDALTGWSRLGIMTAEAIRSYMLANDDHEFYLSTWGKTLRSGRDYSGDGASSAPQAIMGCAPSTSNYLFYVDGFSAARSNYTGLRNCPGGAGNAATNGTLNPVWDTPGGTPFHASVAAQGWVGSLPAGAGATTGPFWMTGDGYAWSNHNQPGPSWILEMAYLEDLTVSGRSYAEVDALDHALFTAAHAEGGVWYGDTFTDPATLP